ncbi:MAG: hypothetical protein A4E53_00889 [Pelotomaculum sp. PtaB.Bin104]|nr:MAG: hypothetical protein A4E53_00889 [Pelotomaculum sp. PtaB.Bin104]
MGKKKKTGNAGQVRTNGVGKPEVEDLDDKTAEDLITIEEGDRPLPEGWKVIKEWHF